MLLSSSFDDSFSSPSRHLAQLPPQPHPTFTYACAVKATWLYVPRKDDDEASSTARREPLFSNVVCPHDFRSFHFLGRAQDVLPRDIRRSDAVHVRSFRLSLDNDGCNLSGKGSIHYLLAVDCVNADM